MSLSGDLKAAIDPVSWWEHVTGGRQLLDSYQKHMLQYQGDQLIVASRQSGKSHTCSLKAVHRAIFYPNSLIILVSPTMAQSVELGMKCADAAMIARADTTSESMTHINFRNGSRIVCLPGSESSARGYSNVALIVVDEASRCPDEVYFAVKPMLSVSRGQCICVTTPFLKRGFFYDYWTNPDNHWDKTKVTWRDIPRIDKDFIEEERRGIPEKVFKMEYECCFLDADDIGVFSVEMLEKCVDHSGRYQALKI